MKKYYSFVCILLFAVLNLPSKDNNNLPQPLGETGLAIVYYFSPIPSRQDSGYTNDIKLYISSGVEETVTVKVESKGIELTKKTIPNDFIEFSIPASIGQVYIKNDEDKPPKDTIYVNAAIKVTSSAPYSCYCTIGGSKSMAGFIALPMQQLGKNYILSSHPDYSNNVTEFFPGEATITAVSDKTKVKIIKKHSDIPDTTDYLMHSGDVLLLSTTGFGDDLTGTVIEATKPVAVVSGNYCAFIPENSQRCDMIAEFEIPTRDWGTEYYVPFIFNQKSNPIIKIFAEEDSTKIYRDNEYIGTILTSGGKEGSGFLQMLSDTGSPRPVIISGDKPINVVLYIPGSTEDASMTSPAQLALMPLEQFTGSVSFKIIGSLYDYLLLIYKSTEIGEIPDEMEFAQVIQGDYEWIKLKELSPNPGTPFNNFNERNFFLKQILMPQGVYRVRNNEPFAAYICNNEYSTTQLFQAGYSYGDYTKVDTLPPIPKWEMGCCGDVTGVLQDTGDIEDRTNLAIIYMHSDISFNYKLKVEEFMPCEASSATWSLESIDCNEDAFAVITFADCAGNDSTAEIRYYAPNIEFSSEDYRLLDIKIDSVYEKLIWLYNRSENSKPTITNLELKNNTNGFSILDTSYNQITLPLVIDYLDSLPLILRFSTSNAGRFKDTIIVRDTCNNIISNCYFDAFTEGTIIDTLPPIPEWVLGCDGTVNVQRTGYVTDKPDEEENRSNMSTIYLDAMKSYNYKLYHGEFMPCEVQTVPWRLEIIDNREDARAVVQFADCAGNDTTVIIEYYAVKLGITPQIQEFPLHSIGQATDKRFRIVNQSSTSAAYLKYLMLQRKDEREKPQGFTIWDSTGTSELPTAFGDPNNHDDKGIRIEPLDSLPFIIRFEATKDGEFWDSIGIGYTCDFWYKSFVYTLVSTPVIDNITTDINIQIIPNPASDILTITSDKQINEIKIFDILGCERDCPFSISVGRTDVNTSELNNGIYFLLIKSENKFIIEKFVICK